MEVAFYLAGIVALAATVRVITCANAVHALLYLIVSLLAVAIVFFALGAPFSATLEVVVYAGAIMVLFVFVVMMLNLNKETVERERSWLAPRLWIGPGIFSAALLLCMAFALAGGGSIGSIDGTPVAAKAIGMQLYGPYVLLVELAAFVLLAALVVATYIGRDDRKTDQSLERAAEKGERGLTQRR